jgi:uncharacterized protein (AIM24 family)
MSKVKVTIEGDMKFAGFLEAILRRMVDPEKTPLTKISPTHFEAGPKISFEMESRI